MFNIQKRCARILFGDNYSFDHPEYYLTCARARIYMDHTTPKDYSLEQKRIRRYTEQSKCNCIPQKAKRTLRSRVTFDAAYR